MVDFSLKNSWYQSSYGAQAEYSRIVKDIRECIDRVNTEKVSLGYKLKAYYESNTYRCRACDSDVTMICGSRLSSNCHSAVFFAACELDFGLDKSQVSRLINIVDEFGDGKGDLLECWKPFTWSVLVEMLSLTYEQRKAIGVDWTVKKVKEYKKTLVATSQQKNDQEEIDFEALDAAIVGEPKGEYDKCKPAELRNILRQRDDEITRLKNEIRELREGEKYKKLEEDLAYYKRLAIQSMASDDAAET